MVTKTKNIKNLPNKKKHTNLMLNRKQNRNLSLGNDKMCLKNLFTSIKILLII